MSAGERPWVEEALFHLQALVGRGQMSKGLVRGNTGAHMLQNVALLVVTGGLAGSLVGSLALSSSH